MFLVRLNCSEKQKYVQNKYTQYPQNKNERMLGRYCCFVNGGGGRPDHSVRRSVVRQSRRPQPGLLPRHAQKPGASFRYPQTARWRYLIVFRSITVICIVRMACIADIGISHRRLHPLQSMTKTCHSSPAFIGTPKHIFPLLVQAYLEAGLSAASPPCTLLYYYIEFPHLTPCLSAFRCNTLPGAR